jgi:hypothetical protein
MRIATKRFQKRKEKQEGKREKETEVCTWN